MVALLSSDPTHSNLDTFAPTAVPQPRARHLHVLPSPRAGARPAVGTADEAARRPASLLWVGTALVVALLAFASLRVAHRIPPATSWAEVHQGISTPSPRAPVAGEWVRTVGPGETLWGIAGEIAPDADRREVVQRLAERNGRSRLLAGQALIIPAGIAPPAEGKP